MFNTLRYSLLLALAALVVGGCATLPSGPSVFVLPGTGKSFEQFRADDLLCRQYAQDQVLGLTPSQAANESAVRSAAAGTALGAAAGAAVHGGRGAAAGAGIGLLMGALAGTGAAQGSAASVQRRYDFAYVQCMYAQGDRIPAPRELASRADEPVSSLAPPPPPPPPPPR